MLRSGKDVRSLPADALLTPSARDFLRELETRGHPQTPARQPTREVSAAKPLTSKSSKSELEAFFNSPHSAGAQAADLRDRPATLAARLRGRQRRQHRHPRGRGHRALHTHAGFEGLHEARGHVPGGPRGQPTWPATKKRTSEILMHLQIMKRQPRAVATVHCHPPYATGVRGRGRRAAHLHDPRVRGLRLGGHGALSHAGHAGDGQAGRRPGGQAQHHSDGQPRRGQLGATTTSRTPISRWRSSKPIAAPCWWPRNWASRSTP